MIVRTSHVVLSLLVLLSVGLNVVQFDGYTSREEWRNKYSVQESLVRLSVDSKIITDSRNSHSIESLKLLHGEAFMDLTRIHPNIERLGAYHRQQLQEILADLNDLRISNPEMFGRDKMVMDDSMYDRYVGWISSEIEPE